MSEEVTLIRTVVEVPRDERRGSSLGVAGQGQALAFVQGDVARQLLEGRPHVDGQVDVLPGRAPCVGGHACEHASIPGLCVGKQRGTGSVVVKTSGGEKKNRFLD